MPNMVRVSTGSPAARETASLRGWGRPNQWSAPSPISGTMSKNVAALANAWKNHAASTAKITCMPPPNRGQRTEMSVTPIKMSIGLRYCTNINPTFDCKDS